MATTSSNILRLRNADPIKVDLGLFVILKGAASGSYVFQSFTLRKRARAAWVMRMDVRGIICVCLRACSRVPTGTAETKP